jgi:hypothetical protein
VPSRGVIQVVAGIAVGVYVVVLLLQRGPQGSLIAPYGLIVFLSSVVLFLFDRWLWRWPLIKRIHSRPALDGTWHGEIKSTWAPDGGDGTIVSDVFLVFRQRFWSLSFRLLTVESESSPVSATLSAAADGVCRFIGVYRNEPDAAHRSRSNIHYGTLTMKIPDKEANELSGSYWTDRETTGDLVVRRLDDRHIASHADGLAEVQKQQPEKFNPEERVDG